MAREARLVGWLTLGSLASLIGGSGVVAWKRVQFEKRYIPSGAVVILTRSPVQLGEYAWVANLALVLEGVATWVVYLDTVIRNP